MDFLSSELSELSFVPIGQAGGAVDSDFELELTDDSVQQWADEDFKKVYEKAIGFAKGEQTGGSVQVTTESSNVYEQIARELFGGKRELPIKTVKLSQIAKALSDNGLSYVNNVGVASLIWDAASSEAGTSTDIDKILMVSLRLAKNPETFVDKFQRLKKIGEAILNKSNEKAVKNLKMNIAKHAWTEASKKAGTTLDYSKIESIAIDLINQNLHKYVKEIKEEQKRKASK